MGGTKFVFISFADPDPYGLGLPDPLVRGTDLGPEPSIIKHK